MSQPQWIWSDGLKQHYYIVVENGRTVYVCRDGTRHRGPDQRDPRNSQKDGSSLNPSGSYQYDDQYTTAGDVAQLTDQTERMNLAGSSSRNVQDEYSNPPERRDANGVASRVIVGPQGQKVLLGSSGEQEMLSADYRKRANPRAFFKVGKVFLTLWSEPSGPQDNDTVVTRVRFSEHVYTQIRRFVVVREGHRHCIAVPISTYGGRALSKRDAEPADHALIYTGTQPQLNPSDEGIIPIPLQVDPSEAGERLDPLSRVNLAKMYTIEHNLKVKPLGMIRNVPALVEAVYQATGLRLTQTREEVASPNVVIPPQARSGTWGTQRRTTDGMYQQPGSRSVGQQAVTGSSGQAPQATAAVYLRSQLQAGQITNAQYQYGMDQLAAQARAVQAVRAQQAAEDEDEDEDTSDEEEDGR